MIGKAEKRQAACECKERRHLAGIYAIDCSATGRRWVDVALNLGAAQNGQFFQLRQHLHRNKKLQAEWNSQGETVFSFKVLEVLPEAIPQLNLRDVFAERKRVWAQEP